MSIGTEVPEEPQAEPANPAIATDALAEAANEGTPSITDKATPATDSGHATTDQVLETYLLHPAAVRVWAWTQTFVIATILVPVSIVGAVAAGPWSLVGNLLVGVLAWRIGSRHLRMAVERFRCERFARGLRYRHGVWWQSETFIPSARVQHTEVNQGPIARRFGLGTLKVFTAAVQLGALEIDGLAYADALLLRDRLLSRNIPLSDEGLHAGEDAEQHVGQQVVPDVAQDVAQRVEQDAAARDV